MTYRDYITSDLWRIRKRRYFETHERKCRACSSRKRIHLHHKTYKRLGEERDADLVPLCHSCHTSLHTRQKKSGENLWLLTEEFIRGKKRRYKNNRTKKRSTTKRNTRRK
jgi:phage terminase large subunit GpA-like protein